MVNKKSLLNLSHAGRPKGTKNGFSILDLQKAVKLVERKKRIDFWEHAVNRALVNDSVLIKLIDKFIPSKNEHTGKDGADLIPGMVQFVNLPLKYANENKKAKKETTGTGTNSLAT